MLSQPYSCPHKIMIADKQFSKPKPFFLSEFIQEDVVLLTTEDFLTEQSRKLFQDNYNEYLQKEGIASCRIGLPFLVLEKRFENPIWLNDFVNDFSCPTKIIYYMDLESAIRPSKWLIKYPELLENKELYIRASRNADWNDFLNSIWDFNKANIQLLLLDTNCILEHSKSQKIIQSLIFRGVSLGFHGDFPKSWWHSRNRYIKLIADWGVLDFWQTNSFTIESKEYAIEKGNKLNFHKYSKTQL